MSGEAGLRDQCGQPGPDQPQPRGEVSGEAADLHHPGHRPRDGGEEGEGDQGGQCWEDVASTMYDVQMH